MNNPTANARRAANRAAYDALRAAYDALPSNTRAALNEQFKAERARNATIAWSRYIEVVLPLLPPEAR